MKVVIVSMAETSTPNLPISKTIVTSVWDVAKDPWGEPCSRPTKVQGVSATLTSMWPLSAQGKEDVSLIWHRKVVVSWLIGIASTRAIVKDCLVEVRLVFILYRRFLWLPQTNFVVPSMILIAGLHSQESFIKASILSSITATNFTSVHIREMLTSFPPYARRDSDESTRGEFSQPNETCREGAIDVHWPIKLVILPREVAILKEALDSLRHEISKLWLLLQLELEQRQYVEMES